MADLNISKFLSGANKKVFVFKPTKPTSTFKKVETKFNTKTSDYVIKVRKKRQDPDLSDQLQPHP